MPLLDLRSPIFITKVTAYWGQFFVPHSTRGQDSSRNQRNPSDIHTSPAGSRPTCNAVRLALEHIT